LFDLIQERDLGKPLALRTMVYVITHGEENPENPEKLSERGKIQIDELVRSRVAVGVRKVYSSSQKVAMATAGILRREFNTLIEVKDCFSPISFGENGKSDEVIATLLSKMWQDPEFSPTDGESLLQARRRFADCLNHIGKKHSGESVAIVTDPLSSTLILWLITGGALNLDDFLQMGYAACAAYEYTKDGWILVMPPDNSFLSNPCVVRDKLSPELIESLEKASEKK
jgi:broad specificity phosphatase PhoE